MTDIRVGAAAAAMLLLAPAAHADTTNPAIFLRHMHAMGFKGTSSDDDLIAAGHQACAGIRVGTPVALLQQVAEAQLAPKGVPAAKADLFITYSITDLCPDALSASYEK